MALVLFALVLVAVFQQFSPGLIIRLVIILGATLGFEFLLWKIRRVDPFVPWAGVVSALIIFILSDPVSPVFLPLIAVAVAVSGKQIFRFSGRHTLNPAAAGLFVSSFLGNNISWWGTNGTVALIVILIGASFVSLFTIRQYKVVVPFVVISLIFSFLVAGRLEAATGQLMVGAFWFFALVMLPEPVTAAQKQEIKPFYGAIVAILSFVLVKFPFDPFLLSLLLGNAAARMIEETSKKVLE